MPATNTSRDTQQPFLAQVEELYENEADPYKYKSMKCRFFILLHESLIEPS